MSDIKLPVSFKQKVTLPPSVDGSGYPYRISANDLDQNFAYAALGAEDGWIDQTSVGDHAGRKLKLPAIPSGEGIYILSVNGGQLTWSEWQELSVSMCDNNYEKTGTILFRES